MSTPRTLFDKVWDAHVVVAQGDEPAVLYVDLHLVHEVTSPQAFEGLRLEHRSVRRPQQVVATMDHNIPTTGALARIDDDLSRAQVEALSRNCAETGIRLFGRGHAWQGIVHVIGPELGLSLPGTVIACGDSHTATHGAFGAFALGVGTSEVELVLATQCLRLRRPRTMEVRIEGALPVGVTAKDLALGVLHRIGTAGGAGHVIEYTGAAVRALSMEERMTLCNMSIEGGARAGMVAPDETTFEYLQGRPYAPAGALWEQAVRDWRALATDPGAVYDSTVVLDASRLEPTVTWGTTPAQSAAISGSVPDPADFADPAQRESAQRALAYMGLEAGTPLQGLPVDVVFIGSCTNARIEDLRAAAQIFSGRRVASGVEVLVVPGSALVHAQAEREGLDRIFRAAGAQWRSAGCSACLGMNPDVVPEGSRCASTSNRNFEGRQGRGARTHLVSPAMAAAAAVSGRFVDVRTLRAQTAVAS